MNEETIKSIQSLGAEIYFALLTAGLMQEAWDFAGYQVQLDKKLGQLWAITDHKRLALVSYQNECDDHVYGDVIDTLRSGDAENE